MKIFKNTLTLIILSYSSMVFCGTTGGYHPDDIEISEAEIESYRNKTSDQPKPSKPTKPIIKN